MYIIESFISNYSEVILLSELQLLFTHYWNHVNSAVLTEILFYDTEMIKKIQAAI